MTLEVNKNEAAARIVKARLERTTLGQVAKRIRATLRPVSSMAVCDPPHTQPQHRHSGAQAPLLQQHIWSNREERLE